MEEELRCPHCRQFLRQPVLLPCGHSYCRECALQMAQRYNNANNNNATAMTMGSTTPNCLPPSIGNAMSPPAAVIPCSSSSLAPSSSSSGASDTLSLAPSCSLEEADHHHHQSVLELDKLSLLSDSDSGFGGGGNGAFRPLSSDSRPSSFLSTSARPLPLPPALPCSILSPSSPHSSSSSTVANVAIMLQCQSCRKPAYFADEEALRKMPENLAVTRLVAKHQQARRQQQEQLEGRQQQANEQPVPECQWCEDGVGGATVRPAKFHCAACGYFYCADCQQALHPPRGPLKFHQLVPASQFINSRSTFQSSLLDLTFSSSSPSLNCSSPTFASSSSNSQPTTTPINNNNSCELHFGHELSRFCSLCRQPICQQCAGETRHSGHPIQSLAAATKAHKTELSQSLQLLGTKVRQATEDISALKQLSLRIDANAADFQRGIERQMDELEALLRLRRQQLLDFAAVQAAQRKAQLRDQIGKSAVQLGKGRALIQFCIEILKEPEPVAYLQAGQALATRVTDQEFLWHRQVCTKPEVDIEQCFHLDLDTQPARAAIEQLQFAQLKAGQSGSQQNHNQELLVNKGAPSAPQFLAEECSAENNSVTLAWSCPSQHNNGTVAVDGFVLELLDSGQQRDISVYREVYCGPESACTVDGLHFNTLYTARVKAFNTGAGDSAYSEGICLQTAQVAWFQLSADSNVNTPSTFAGNDQQRECSPPSSGSASAMLPADDIYHCSSLLALSNNFCTVTGTSLDYRTVLGAVTFSRGQHYWEVSVDRYDGNADIVIGIAQPTANRQSMLGKDLHGWSMYVDDERTWFFHDNKHHGRMCGGISGAGSIIGVLMDLDAGTLSFTIDKRPVCLHAFKNIPRGLFCPAFSVNCKSQITVHSGLKVPEGIADELMLL